MKKNIFGIIALAIVLVPGYMYYVKSKAPSSIIPGRQGDALICTSDAKLCPDGSYVGRVGPRCEFAECPEVKK